MHRHPTVAVVVAFTLDLSAAGVVVFLVVVVLLVVTVAPSVLSATVVVAAAVFATVVPKVVVTRFGSPVRVRPLRRSEIRPTPCAGLRSVAEPCA